jgi:hypothetical protein
MSRSRKNHPSSLKATMRSEHRLLSANATISQRRPCARWLDGRLSRHSFSRALRHLTGLVVDIRNHTMGNPCMPGVDPRCRRPVVRQQGAVSDL